MKLGRLVVIEWIDAAFHLDDEPEPHRVKTVGYVISDESAHITVASEQFLDGSHRGYTTIPRSCVVRVLEVAQTP